MEVICPTCGIEYDDTYRLTVCPHETFEMRTAVVVKGEERVATSVEQLNAWIEEDRAWRSAGGS